MQLLYGMPLMLVLKVDLLLTRRVVVAVVFDDEGGAVEVTLPVASYEPGRVAPDCLSSWKHPGNSLSGVRMWVRKEGSSEGCSPPYSFCNLGLSSEANASDLVAAE